MANKQITVKRVVISGLGLVTPVGIGTEESWRQVVAGVSGAAEFKSIDHSEFPVHFGCEVKDFDVTRWIDARDARRLDKFVHFGVAAANLAVAHGKIDFSQCDRDRCGAVFASGIGGILSVEAQLDVFYKKGPRRISPFSVPLLMVNAASGQLAMEFGLRGINYATVSACSSANHAIGLAYRHVQLGEADVILTGGSEAGIGIMGLGGFANMKALSTRNAEPTRASRPFDRGRDGFVMGEGAGVLILEELEHAKKRGAKIYAEVLGYGFTDDASHITAPDENGGGVARAMGLAIKNAGLAPEQVDYINAHGTSTPLNDASETKGIKTALGEAHAKKVAVSSTKSCTGHMLGATAAAELAFTTLAIDQGIIPPTINYENPDPLCDLDYTPNKAQKREINYALSNSLGFGGHNTSVLIGKYVE